MITKPNPDMRLISKAKLAEWLYNQDADRDSHGVLYESWEERSQGSREAYFSYAIECLEACEEDV